MRAYNRLRNWLDDRAALREWRRGSGAPLTLEDERRIRAYSDAGLIPTRRLPRG